LISILITNYLLHWLKCWLCLFCFQFPRLLQSQIRAWLLRA